MIDYAYLGEAELLKRLAAIDEALDGGSQTSVGIEPRISHQFKGKTDDELRLRRSEYWDSLVKMARTSGNPELIAKYPPREMAGITRMDFSRRGLHRW